MHIPRLYRDRHGTYYLRVTRHHRTQKRTLGTKDPRIARLKALAFNLVVEMHKQTLGEFDFATLDKLDIVLPNGLSLKNINTPEDMARAQALISAYAPGAPLGPDASSRHAPSPKGPSFSKVVTDYLGEYNAMKLNKVKTLDEKRHTYEEFSAYIGDERMASYTKTNAVQFKQHLVGLGLSANRINKKLSNMRELFKWASENDMFPGDVNPFTEAKVGTKKLLAKQTQSYVPFSTAEVGQIFDAMNYGRMFVSQRSKKTLKKSAHYYWVPLLGYYTGARLEELCSLTVQQVKTDADVTYFEITKEVAKNQNSVRKVPVHSKLVELGFLTYVKSLPAAGQVFPELVSGKNGYSKNVSRRFGEYLDSLGISSPMKVFHSLRYNFVERLTELNVHPAMIMGLVGHVDQAAVDMSSTHFRTYHKPPKAIEILRDNIDRLDIVLTPGPF